MAIAADSLDKKRNIFEKAFKVLKHPTVAARKMQNRLEGGPTKEKTKDAIKNIGEEVRNRLPPTPSPKK